MSGILISYYNLPLIVYAYSKGVIAIQILIPRQLYSLKTVPVPFHINEQEMDEYESKYTHAKLIPSTKILGMRTDTYIKLDR